LPVERAEASKIQFAHGKSSLFQRFNHFDADGAGRADHGHMWVPVHKRVNL